MVIQKKSAAQEYYDVTDPFIDDSELAVDERTFFAQTKQQGFYVSSGQVALLTDKCVYFRRMCLLLLFRPPYAAQPSYLYAVFRCIFISGSMLHLPTSFHESCVILPITDSAFRNSFYSSWNPSTNPLPPTDPQERNPNHEK